MLYEDLHQRYGRHIAKRVQLELNLSEFKHVVVEELPLYLETRAALAQKEYQKRLHNPYVTGKATNVDELYDRWRDAEDLSSLVNVAEDVSASSRLMMTDGHVNA